MIAVPTPSLEWLSHFDDGRSWLDSLPTLVDLAVKRWGLEIVGPPFEGGMCGLVQPVVAAGTVDAVLKLQFPHDESAYEADALRLWNGSGAIQLLEHDESIDALLLERCLPGRPLSTVGRSDAITVMAGLVEQLSLACDEVISTLATEAERWRRDLPVRWKAFEPELVEHTIRLIDELVPTQGPQVLIHQDLHGDNVLAASRRPWLAIDPKPVVGEVAFALAPIIRSGELGHTRVDVVTRLDSLSAALHVDRERARGWAIVQTMAWGIEDDAPIEAHLEVVRWLLDA